MKKTNDQYRHFLDELETMIENEKGLFKKVKEAYKDAFTFKSLEELFKKKKRAYDYAFTKLLNAHGVNTGNIRKELDKIWDKNFIEQENWRILFRPLSFFPILGSLDNTDTLKNIIWTNYLDDTLRLAKEIWKQ